MAFTFKTALEDLFSRQVIVKRLPGGAVSLVDFNKTKSDDFAYYRRFRRAYVNPARSISFADIETVEAARIRYYTDYELMDTDAIISTALDIYADEATTNNAQGELLAIVSDNPELKNVLNNFFYDVLDIEHSLWFWVRNLVKNGDFLLYNHIEPGVGITHVTPIHPINLRRIDSKNSYKFEYNNIIGFGSLSQMFEDKKEFGAHEIIHFRLMSDANLLPYGRSMIEGARKSYKQMVLMEDAMLLHRIMRAPEKRVFKIDVGLIPPTQVDNHMENIIADNKKTPYMDENGDYNLKFNLMNMMEDYYMPVRGAKSGTEITTLDGLKNDGNIEDLEYIKNKMISYLKIPKSYLNFNDNSDGKNTLAAMDIRFARTIDRVQKVIISELYKLAIIHLYSQGFTEEDLLSFDLKLSTSSIIYERQKIEMLNEKAELMKSLIESNLFSREYIYEHLFSMSKDEWEHEQLQVLEDIKRRFRETQISEEGNDPVITGKAYGTPHALAYASWQISDDEADQTPGHIKDMYATDGRADNEGQPPIKSLYGNEKDDILGKDPDGGMELGKRLANTEVVRFKKNISTYSKDLKRTMVNEDDENNSEIEMLNENQFDGYDNY